MTRLLALSLVLTLAACASPKDPQVAQDDAAKARCTREIPTGSNFPVTRCRTQAEIDKDREAADAALRSHGPSPVVRPSTGS